MMIVVLEPGRYDSGVHPEVTWIIFRMKSAETFFRDNRFPNLVYLDCCEVKLTELELNCPSLQVLDCSWNFLTKLELNCPSLQDLNCYGNKLSKLEVNCPSLQNLSCFANQLTSLYLNCPSLQILDCSENRLTNLNGIEFCTELKKLCCSKALKESAEILEIHLQNLKVVYEKD